MVIVSPCSMHINHRAPRILRGRGLRQRSLLSVVLLLASVYPCVRGQCGIATSIAGSGTSGLENGPAANARFSNPAEVAVSPDGKIALVADEGNNLVRKLDLVGLQASTLAGSTQGSQDGTGEKAPFREPSCIAVSPAGDVALVCSGHAIKRLDLRSREVKTQLCKQPHRYLATALLRADASHGPATSLHRVTAH